MTPSWSAPRAGPQTLAAGIPAAGSWRAHSDRSAAAAGWADTVAVAAEPEPDVDAEVEVGTAVAAVAAARAGCSSEM